MKKFFFAVFFTVLISIMSFSQANQITPKSCVEMMKLHYKWVALEKCDLAARQLESAENMCKRFLKNPLEREELARLTESDEQLVNLYGQLLDKNVNPQSICPAPKV